MTNVRRLLVGQCHVATSQLQYASPRRHSVGSPSIVHNTSPLIHPLSRSYSRFRTTNYLTQSPLTNYLTQSPTHALAQHLTHLSTSTSLSHHSRSRTTSHSFIYSPTHSFCLSIIRTLARSLPYVIMHTLTFSQTES